MKTTHRPYSEEVGDYNRLARFIVDHDADIRRYSTWCIGRFVDWKYGVYENKTTVPDFCSRNAQLWFDAFQAVAGFVIAEDGGPGFAIITRAGYRLLFAEMLAWVVQNWGKRGPQLSIEITEQQTLEAGILEQYAFSHARPHTQR